MALKRLKHFTLNIGAGGRLAEGGDELLVQQAGGNKLSRLCLRSIEITHNALGMRISSFVSFCPAAAIGLLINLCHWATVRAIKVARFELRRMLRVSKIKLQHRCTEFVAMETD